MDSTLALGAFRIARGAGGEAVREREPRRAGEASPKPPPKPPPKPRSGLCPELLADFRIPKPPGCSQGRRGQFSVQSDNRFSGRGGGVGSLPRAWRRVGVPGAAGAKKNCEIGVGFSFAALSVFRLRRAEAGWAVWIPHWHWEPFESQGARAAKRWTRVAGRFSDSETSWVVAGAQRAVFCAV